MAAAIVLKENTRKVGNLVTRQNLTQVGFFGAIVDGAKDNKDVDFVIRSSIDNNANSFLSGFEVKDNKTFIACVLIQQGVSPDAALKAAYGERCQGVLEEIMTAPPVLAPIATNTRPADYSQDDAIKETLASNPKVTAVELMMKSKTLFNNHWVKYAEGKIGKPFNAISKSDFNEHNIPIYSYNLADMGKFLTKESPMNLTAPEPAQTVAQPAQPVAPAQQAMPVQQTAQPVAQTAQTDPNAEAKTFKVGAFVKILSGDYKDKKGNITEVNGANVTVNVLDVGLVTTAATNVHPARNRAAGDATPAAPKQKAIKGNEAAAIVKWRYSLKIGGQAVPHQDVFDTKEAAEAAAAEKHKAINNAVGYEVPAKIEIIPDKTYESVLIVGENKIVGSGDALADKVIEFLTKATLAQVLESKAQIVFGVQAHAKDFNTKMEAAYGEKSKVIVKLFE